MADIKFRKRAVSGGGTTLDLVVDGIAPEVYDVAVAGQYEHIVTITTQSGTAIGVVQPDEVTVVQNPDNTDIVIPMSAATFTQGDITTLVNSSGYRNTPWSVTIKLNKWLGEPVVEEIESDPTGLAYAEGWEIVDNYLYTYGGTNVSGVPVSSFKKLNLNTGEWSNLPFPGYTNRFSGFLGLRDGHLYTVATGQVAKYNLSTGQWTQLALGMQVVETATVMHGDYIYELCGISTNLATYIDYFRIYSILNDTWANVGKPAAMTGGFSCRLAAVGNKLYAVGGAKGTPHNQVFSYDIPTDTWTQLANFPTSVMAGALVAESDRLIYIGGLTSASPFTVSSAIVTYDIATNTWTTSSISIPVAGRYLSATKHDNGLLVGHLFSDAQGAPVPGIWHVTGV